MTDGFWSQPSRTATSAATDDFWGQPPKGAAPAAADDFWGQPSKTPAAASAATPAGQLDYDMPGYIAKYGPPDQSKGQHLTDEFKLPNHITFSTGSKYSSGEKTGGKWSKDDSGKWHFAPSAWNLQQHSPEKLKDYFARVEPDSVLDLPKESAAADDFWGQPSKGAAGDTTQLGAALRGAARSVVPLAAGVGLSRAVGAGLGMLGAGPAGSFIGGTLGGLAGGYVGDVVQRALGLAGGPQEQADVAQYPKTSMVAGAAPLLALGRPSLAPDLARRAAGAATMGAIETGSELARGGFGALDPGRIAFQAGVGGALNVPTPFGRRVSGEPAVPERVPEGAPLPGEKPADIPAGKPAAAGLTAGLPERVPGGVPKPEAAEYLPGMGEGPPAGAAAGAERTAPVPITHGLISDIDHVLRQKRQQDIGGIVQMGQHLASRPPEMLPREKAIFQAVEQNPDVVLDPQARAFMETRTIPERDEVDAQWKENRRFLNANGMEDLDDAVVASRDPAYIHRYTLNYASQFPEIRRALMGEYADEPPAKRQFIGAGPSAPSSSEGRSFFTLFNPGKGQRLMDLSRNVLNEVDGKGKYPLREHLDDVQTRAARKLALQRAGYNEKAISRMMKEAPDKPYAGMQFMDKDGTLWTLRHARTGEIEAKTGIRYIKNASIANALAKLEQQKLNRELRLFDNIKAKLVAEGHASTKRKPGFQQTDTPGFTNLWVDPRVKRALDRAGRYDPGQGILAHINKLNGWLTRSFMVNPVAHLRNVGTQFLIHENIGLLDFRKSKLMREAWHDAFTMNDSFWKSNDAGARFWLPGEKAGDVLTKQIQGELEATGHFPPVKSIQHRLGDIVFAPWRFSHHVISVAQDALIQSVIKMRLNEGKPMEAAVREANSILGYDIPTEVPHPELPGMAGKVTTALAQLPARISEDQWGRWAFNFMRWNYLKARAAFAPFIGTAGGVLKGDPKMIAEYGSRAAALLIAQQLFLPYGDKWVQQMTGDQRSRMTRWGSFAVIQAFDDILHGRGTKYEALSLALLNLSPATLVARDVANWVTSKGLYGRAPTMAEVGKQLLTQDVPLVSMVTRPLKEPQPVTSFAAEQAVGIGKTPRTYEEQRQAEMLRRMQPKVPKPAKPPSPVPWLY